MSYWIVVERPCTFEYAVAIAPTIAERVDSSTGYPRARPLLTLRQDLDVRVLFQLMIEIFDANRWRNVVVLQRQSYLDNTSYTTNAFTMSKVCLQRAYKQWVIRFSRKGLKESINLQSVPNRCTSSMALLR